MSLSLGAATQHHAPGGGGGGTVSFQATGREIDEAPLSHLIGLLEMVRDQHNAPKRAKLLENFWRSYGRKVGNRYIPDFRILRLMCPELDRERPVYNLKEASIAKLYCEIHMLPKDHEDAVELMNWRDPTMAAGGGGGRRGGGDWRNMGQSVAGIFPAVLFKVMHKRSPQRSTLTVRQLNKMLDDLYRASKTEKQDRLRKLFMECTAKEMEWVTRIILKDLKIGMNHGVILKWFHRDGAKHFDGCQNLKNVCADLEDPNWTFANDIKPNEVISPMLAQRVQYAGALINVAKDLGNRFAIETKYDGDRMLCHKEGDLIRFYTRNGNEDPNLAARFQAKRLLFQGLPDTVDENDLQVECEKGQGMRGAVLRVEKIKQTMFKGEPTRYGFVEFSSHQLCVQAEERLRRGCAQRPPPSVLCAASLTDALVVCRQFARQRGGGAVRRHHRAAASRVHPGGALHPRRRDDGLGRRRKAGVGRVRAEQVDGAREWPAGLEPGLHGFRLPVRGGPGDEREPAAVRAELQPAEQHVRGEAGCAGACAAREAQLGRDYWRRKQIGPAEKRSPHQCFQGTCPHQRNTLRAAASCFEF